MTYNTLKNKLETIANQNEETVEKMIAYDALNYNEADCTEYFKNLLTPTDANNMALHFMAYSIYETMYEMYKDDILKKQKALRISLKDLSEFQGYLIGNLCWMVLEETAIKMAKELEIEV